jgi:hypothetical protein
VGLLHCPVCGFALGGHRGAAVEYHRVARDGEGGGSTMSLLMPEGWHCLGK